MKRTALFYSLSILFVFITSFSNASFSVDAQLISKLKYEGNDTIKGTKRGVPIPDFSISNRSPCVGDTVWFTDKSTGHVVSFWDFDDGQTTYMKDTNPYHIYNEAGIYNITLKAIAEDGSFQVTNPPVSILVSARPTIGLLFTPDKTTIEQGDMLEVSVIDHFNEYEWISSINGVVGTERILNLTDTDSDIYNVWVTDEYGCRNNEEFEIVVTPRIDPVGYDANKIIVENNILTPNADGFNDYLIVRDLSVYKNDLEVQIYNAWGDLVYSTKKYDNTWDGTDKRNLDAGTYYYVMKCLEKNGLVGFIDIIR